MGVRLYARHALLRVDTSLPAQRLVRVMEQLEAERGLPNQVRVANGSELVSSTFACRLVRGAWHRGSLYPKEQTAAERIC